MIRTDYLREDQARMEELMAVAHNAIVSDDSRFRLTPDHYLQSRKEMQELRETRQEQN